MRSSGLVLGITWFLTVVVGFVVGWWKGVRSVTHVEAAAAHTGLDLTMIILIIVALGAAILAFRLRGAVDRRQRT